jgi:hypothetical protein
MGREPDTVDQAAPFGIGPGEGAIQGDIESPWSEASLPQTAMFVPKDPPPQPIGVTVTRSQTAAPQIKIVIPEPPTAAEAAIAPYRVRIWRREPSGSFEAATTAPFTALDENAVIVEEYAVAYADPLGREGVPTIVPVA